MNVGERDELIFKIAMIALRDSHGNLFGKPVTSVGFKSEYGQLPANYNLAQLRNMSDTELSKFAAQYGITKAATGAKSDIYINGNGISLKSLRAAPAALVNHTARPRFEFACRNSGADITFLDNAVSQYWDLRFKCIISEDTRISDQNCPFINYKQKIKPVIEYFLFNGTGSKRSDYPARGIIEFTDPLNSNTYSWLSPDEAFESVWPKLIFSLRAKKGMPADYDPNTYRGKDAESIAKWVRYINEDYRGALHIRCSK